MHSWSTHQLCWVKCYYSGYVRISNSHHSIKTTLCILACIYVHTYLRTHLCLYLQSSLAHHKFYVDADEEQSWINEKMQLLAAIDSLPTDLSSALLMSRKLQVHTYVCVYVCMYVICGMATAMFHCFVCKILECHNYALQ